MRSQCARSADAVSAAGAGSGVAPTLSGGPLPPARGVFRGFGVRLLSLSIYSEERTHFLLREGDRSE